MIRGSLNELARLDALACLARTLLLAFQED